MYDWVYTELNGRLDYAYQYLGSLWCWYGWCWPSSYHTEAINKLNEIATHLLTRPGSSPFLTRAQATTIQQIYTILKANRVDTIDTFLADTAANETVTYANLLTVRTLLESAGQNPFGVDTGGSLSFNMQDVTDTYNEAVSRGVMTRAEADAAIARVNNLNTETMNTILTSISEMRGPGKRLVKNLNQAIRYWEREDAATQQNKPDQAAHYRQMREFYLKECRIQAWALYEITDYVIACSGGTCTVSRR
jgi:hypothetical protein